MIRYTIVAGFLGAGKTSLINSVLSTATERIAVVVNDLGDISLDAALLRANTAPEGPSNVVELANGCVCCTIGDSLAVTLRDLCLRSPAPEHVLVECSGAAEPQLVAAYGSRRVLAEPSIVTVVDATDILSRANDDRFAPLVSAQLAAANLLVLSKTDLVSPAQVGQVSAWLRTHYPAAQLVVGHPGSLGALLPESVGSLNLAPFSAPATDLFTTTTETLPGHQDLGELSAQLDADAALVRGKGIVLSHGDAVLVHWAAGRFESTPWTGPVPECGWITLIRSRSLVS